MKETNGNALTITQEISNLPALPKQYKGMLKHIEETMPAITESSANFYKSHSQFMGTMLDVTAISPIRSVKHTLAEIDKTRQALEEAHINLRKKDIEMRQKEERLNEEADELKREMLETEIIHLQVQIKNTNNSIQGAIRKLSYFTTQYKSILKKLGKETITEEEYEDEEETYHIMTCMKQALNAARARGGNIDEGNLIYLFDMGINSAVAQQEIYDYLRKENEMMMRGETPTHEMTMQWLEHCAKRFKGDSLKFAERRGFTLKDNKSLAKLEDKTNG
jgi:septation ring formation regulator EzrA